MCTFEAERLMERRLAPSRCSPENIRRLVALALLLAFGSSAPASPPFQDKLLSDSTVKVSDHVWAIIGFPNIGIVVGDNSTLVVDTGLGRRNGATVARAAKKLAPHNRLFLTTTHFHPEHAAGVMGFPPGTILIRDQVQQDEMDHHGEEMIQMFSRRNGQWKSLLSGEQLRAPDVTFERELRLNLGGGVTARLLWFGAAHTRGDELVFVEPDKTLISGDVVQNKVGPYIYGEGGTAASWIAAVDEAAKLGAEHVLPDHSPIGDGSLVEQERSFLSELRSRALALKRQGESAEKAGQQITAECKKKYPDWNIDDLTSFVKHAYTEGG
jgi:glyoxylase-like metal-dependent hydrolase (beta-lactamase superfamily II)